MAINWLKNKLKQERKRAQYTPEQEGIYRIVLLHENSILVAMATTLDDERMSRHTVSTVFTYVLNMKRESWKLWELECGQEQTDGRTDDRYHIIRPDIYILGV